MTTQPADGDFHPHLPHISSWPAAKQELAAQVLVLLILLALLAGR